jgi:hypothetical protein
MFARGEAEKGLRQTAAPISRLTAGMRERDDFEVVVAFAIDEKKREVAETYAPNRFAEAQPFHSAANFEVGCDQIDCGLNLAPQPIAQTSASALVPMNGFAKFSFRGQVRTNGFDHL